MIEAMIGAVAALFAVGISAAVTTVLHSKQQKNSERIGLAEMRLRVYAEYALMAFRLVDDADKVADAKRLVKEADGSDRYASQVLASAEAKSSEHSERFENLYNQILMLGGERVLAASENLFQLYNYGRVRDVWPYIRPFIEASRQEIAVAELDVPLPVEQ